MKNFYRGDVSRASGEGKIRRDGENRAIMDLVAKGSEYCMLSRWVGWVWTTDISKVGSETIGNVKIRGEEHVVWGSK